MERKNSVRLWSVFAKVAVLGVLAAAAFDGSGAAVAQGGGSPPPDGPESDPTPVIVEAHVPNTLYPDGEGAIPFETLPPEEQAGIELAGEKSDYGAAVHNAWSNAVTKPLAADAKVKKAAYQSGTNGLDTVGVEP